MFALLPPDFALLRALARSLTPAHPPAAGLVVNRPPPAEPPAPVAAGTLEALSSLVAGFLRDATPPLLPAPWTEVVRLATLGRTWAVKTYARPFAFRWAIPPPREPG